MMRIALGALLTTIGTARAQGVCSVAIPRAPENVKAEIELWVRAEPRCSVELEVRVVPTEGGYYLFARDRQGRVRERMVPDAQSAGVLVASWVADDSVIQELDVPPPSVELMPRPGERFEIAPPGVVAPIARRAPSNRWVTLGGIVQIGDPGATGVHADLDLATRGNWTFGAALLGGGTTQELIEESPTTHVWEFGFIRLRDLQALATVSHTSTFGRWHLRIGAGVGATRTSANGELGGDLVTGSEWTPGGDLSILAGREIGANWAFAFGPTLTAYSQIFDLDRNGMTVSVERHQTQLLAFGGLRHRL